jgi:hypothetical protein
LQVVPGMNVKVETVVTRSLNKTELDSRYSRPWAAVGQGVVSLPG